jgi:hypothetical protein
MAERLEQVPFPLCVALRRLCSRQQCHPTHTWASNGQSSPHSIDCMQRREREKIVDEQQEERRRQPYAMHKQVHA